MLLPLLLACVAPDGPRDRPDPAEPFAGITSVEWDGADGLVARWESAEPCTLEVEGPDGRLELEATGGEAHLTGLSDGEYTLRAWRSDPQDDGGRVVHQLVGANRLVFRGYAELPETGGLWAHGDLVVVGGREGGASFYVFDVSDPTRPELLHTAVGFGISKEAKFDDQGRVWIQVEGPPGPDAVGARLWDLADPARPRIVAEIGMPAHSIHNLWIEGDWLYLTDNISNGMRIYDVSDPAAAFEVFHWVPPRAWVHDQVVVRDRAYVSWWDGFTVLDVADPANPVELGTYSGTVPNVHNAWPTEDDRYALVTSEIVGGALSIFDLSDPQDIQLVREVRGLDPATSTHNTHVRGQYAFTAWYGEGVVVHDLSDPHFPREVGRYDTLRHERPGEPVPPGALHGAWEVWPYGEHVVASDKDRGLFVFDFFEPLELASEL